jgi:hypothetical protein
MAETAPRSRSKRRHSGSPTRMTGEEDEEDKDDDEEEEEA